MTLGEHSCSRLCSFSVLKKNRLRGFLSKRNDGSFETIKTINIMTYKGHGANKEWIEMRVLYREDDAIIL